MIHAQGQPLGHLLPFHVLPEPRFYYLTQFRAQGKLGAAQSVLKYPLVIGTTEDDRHIIDILENQIKYAIVIPEEIVTVPEEEFY